MAVGRWSVRMYRGRDMVEKDGQPALPVNVADLSHGQPQQNPRRQRRLLLALAPFIVYYLSTSLLLRFQPPSYPQQHLYSAQVIDRCKALNVKPAPPIDFHERIQSDRFVPGTAATLVKNATIWTGNDDGREILQGNVLLDGGIIRWISKDFVLPAELEGLFIDILDAEGRWLTPGVVDLHSHLAVGASPSLSGTDDSNSIKGPAQPWLRSLDAINTHDDGYRLAIAGGVTTSLILPGSADAIGGQAFAIKLRPTAERSPTSMLLEPPHGLNGSEIDYTVSPRWRHMKHACGENPSRVYHQTRMDTAWNFRETYNKAREIKIQQDAFCEKAINGDWAGQSNFPEELQWEAAVDVLRGKVKVQTHCYEAVDLDNFVRLSNEFKFPIAAFHHAHETYLVPDVLKRAYGDTPPASAMFAAFARYKHEAYRHSEFAPKILNDAGLKVVMKSDHSGIVSRYLLYEAQQAHFYGLPPNVALRSVISNPAEVMGYDHRIGYIREGYDADVVIWDSHPLQLGATPVQVYIDGVAQLDTPFVNEKPSELQSIPKTPDFEKEVNETLKYEGLPPLSSQRILSEEDVIFTNVSNVYTRVPHGIEPLGFTSDSGAGFVVVRNGRIICAGTAITCNIHAPQDDVTVVDLQGGSISPGLVSVGTNLGLQHIGMEPSSTDGSVYDVFSQKVPGIVGGHNTVIRAADGLQFQSRDALLAYRAGVTSAVTTPSGGGFLSGLSVFFSTGAPHRLAPGAIIQDVAALHFTISAVGQPSISTQISALRKILLHEQKGDLGHWIKEVHRGRVPLVINAHSADVIATLLILKQEVESKTGHVIKLTILGGSEAHLLAKELGDTQVGVILNPVRPFPYNWEERRILPGPPLSEESAIHLLMKHNVTVGLGVSGTQLAPEISAWAARNARFEVSWAYIEAGGQISKSQALAIASTNTEKLLGIAPETALLNDLIVTHGGDLFDSESKVMGIISPLRSQVELL